MVSRTTVMIVDDDRRITNFVKTSLELSGYRVVVVNDPAVALATALEAKPHLILLDVSMPNKDGGEVACDLQSRHETAKIPVIFLTAILSSAELGGVFGNRGSRSFLPKPVSAACLVNSVRLTLN